MSLWRQVIRGARVLTRRTAADDELDDEIRHYRDEAEAAALNDGLSPAEAHRAARLQVRDVAAVREEVRASGWEDTVNTVIADLRYAARRLRRAPAFTAVAVVTLSVGIGAATAIFSAIRAVLLDPLPYPHADRIVTISDTTVNGEPLNITFGTYLEVARRSRAFEALAPFKAWQPTLVGGTEPERLSGERVGAEFFRTLGVAPLMGRDFRADDDRPGAADVVILSYELWRRRFGSDPAILGRSIALDGQSLQVVAVMPAGFENILAPSTEVWAPLQYKTIFEPQSREWGHHLRLLGRLREGVVLDSARQELNQIALAPVAAFPRVPWARLTGGFITTSMQADMTRGVRSMLIDVFVGVILLLAIACVNVTNLLLARGGQRRGEFAMRAALGAGRWRLFRQLLTESLLLSVLGGALAMVVATVALGTLVALAPAGLPRAAAIRLDAVVFAFGFLVAALVGMVVGLVPAASAARQDLRASTQETSRRAGSSHHRLRRVLVVAEVAVALVLLTAAGLLFRSIQNVFAVPLGFDSSALLTMQVQQPGGTDRSEAMRSSFYTRTVEAVRELPGVSGAAFTSLLPLSGDIDVYGVHFQTDPKASDDGAAMRYAVTAGYFELMGIPLRSGRPLNERDTAASPRAVVVNEGFARRKFPGRDALGQRLRFGSPEGAWYTIVGVVGDVRQSPLDAGPPDAIYVTPEQWHWVDTSMTVVVRSHGDAAALAAMLRRAIWSVDKDVPIVRVATMSVLAERAVADRRFALVLFEAFGIAALILVTTGVYGVLSGSVTERTHEIGVRSALGASPRKVVALVVRDGLAVGVAGVVVGLAGAAMATRAMGALLFGLSPLDPITYVAVVLLLLGAAVVACAAPAYRAASIDPCIALRAE